MIIGSVDKTAETQVTLVWTKLFSWVWETI